MLQNCLMSIKPTLVVAEVLCVSNIGKALECCSLANMLILMKVLNEEGLKHFTGKTVTI